MGQVVPCLAATGLCPVGGTSIETDLQKISQPQHPLLGFTPCPAVRGLPAWSRSSPPYEVIRVTLVRAVATTPELIAAHTRIHHRGPNSTSHVRQPITANLSCIGGCERFVPCVEHSFRSLHGYPVRRVICAKVRIDGTKPEPASVPSGRTGSSSPAWSTLPLSRNWHFSGLAVD